MNSHFFRSHQIEVGCTRRGRPSYRWVQGYSEALPNASVSQAMRLSDCRHIARSMGRKAVFHEGEPEARAAIENETAATP